MSLDKKEHIMKVAIDLFAERGFEGTSVRDLALHADVNLAMINYYFGSKENLFATLLEQKALFMREKINEVEKDKSLSEIEKLDLIIESYVHRFLSHPNFHRLMQQELLVSKREMLHQNVIDLFVKNTNDVVAIIERGTRKKIFKKVDAQLIFATIIGTINQVVISKSVCNILMNKESENPYEDPQLRKRLILHIKNIVHDHLLIQKHH